MEQLHHAAGILVEADGDTCHSAIAGLSLDIPVITGAVHATSILKSGAFVTLDSGKGTVSSNKN